MNIVVVIAYLVSIPYIVCKFWDIVKYNEYFILAHLVKDVCDVVQPFCEGFFALVKRRCVLSKTFCL